MLAQHWLPFLILGAFVLGVFVPNMLKKDKSLSKYPGFAEYQKRSGLFLSKILELTDVKSASVDAKVNS